MEIKFITEGMACSKCEARVVEKLSSMAGVNAVTAKAADGSMRDALSLLDQCIAFYLGQKLTYDNVLDVLGAVDNEIFSRLTRSVIDSDVTTSLNILDEIIMQGREP